MKDNTTKERYREEIKELTMTIIFLMDDVKYLLDNPKGNDREVEIRNYVKGLTMFLSKGESDG